MTISDFPARPFCFSRLPARSIRALGAAFLALPFLAAAGPAPAADTLIGRFDQWAAYYYQESGQTICYAVSSPVKSEGKYKRRGNIYAFVTHRPGSKMTGEFSIVAGYPLKPASTPKVQIGGHRLNLIVEGDRAWTEDSVADKKLMLAMKRGRSMIIKGVSSRGTKTTDTYSLTGFTAAYKAISKQCKTG